MCKQEPQRLQLLYGLLLSQLPISPFAGSLDNQVIFLHAFSAEVNKKVLCEIFKSEPRCTSSSLELLSHVGFLDLINLNLKAQSHSLHSIPKEPFCVHLFRISDLLPSGG